MKTFTITKTVIRSLKLVIAKRKQKKK